MSKPKRLDAHPTEYDDVGARPPERPAVATSPQPLPADLEAIAAATRC